MTWFGRGTTELPRTIQQYVLTVCQSEFIHDVVGNFERFWYGGTLKMSIWRLLGHQSAQCVMCRYYSIENTVE